MYVSIHTFTRLLRMTKISPRVSVGPNKHVDTNKKLIYSRFEHVTFEFQTHPFHRMASNELSFTIIPSNMMYNLGTCSCLPLCDVAA